MPRSSGTVSLSSPVLNTRSSEAFYSSSIPWDQFSQRERDFLIRRASVATDEDVYRQWGIVSSVGSRWLMNREARSAHFLEVVKSIRNGDDGPFLRQIKIWHMQAEEDKAFAFACSVRDDLTATTRDRLEAAKYISSVANRRGRAKKSKDGDDEGGDGSVTSIERVKRPDGSEAERITVSQGTS